MLHMNHFNNIFILGKKNELKIPDVNYLKCNVEYYSDLRALEKQFQICTKVICIVDLSRDHFSIQSITRLAKKWYGIRWLVILNQSQTKNLKISKFIYEYCIDYFTLPIPYKYMELMIKHQIGCISLSNKENNTESETNSDSHIIGNSQATLKIKNLISRISDTDLNVFFSGDSGVGKVFFALETFKIAQTKHNQLIHIKHDSLMDKNDINHFADIKESIDILIHDIDKFENQQLNEVYNFLSNLTEQYSNSKIRLFVTSKQDLSSFKFSNILNERLYNLFRFIEIKVPTLTARGQDSLLLAEYFLAKFKEKYNAIPSSFTEQAKKNMALYLWPGNVRELYEKVKSVSITSSKNSIDAHDLNLSESSSNLGACLKQAKDDLEKWILCSAMERHNGKIMSAARELGVSRATIYRLFQKHNLNQDTSLDS
ncbi:hypothetical protein CF386_10570 [Paraphotobacterium marinum]|uniref:Sigma-54 factor interaction domain-containing protein n=2 Tax=Paraphotobacterium marinum TaxID=1755811 RepID=A0A220VGK2_9GAMM|nr:hypothetical protein CF386_10570 [Paraphotobacterium marinum]